jgi:hypothetical protein
METKGAGLKLRDRKIQQGVYLQCVGLVSAQQVKHTADILVHNMEGNLTAGQLLHSIGTEKKTHSLMQIMTGLISN